ncbi:hypothetical protein KSP39_PZI010881 [Platanthera zijinensis]|uniref:Uncharacterized protein n=1 Tax=Platanthera zijinensis TaxID=2320716 RepID=A0AAP0G5P5_9ASPA
MASFGLRIHAGRRVSHRPALGNPQHRGNRGGRRAVWISYFQQGNLRNLENSELLSLGLRLSFTDASGSILKPWFYFYTVLQVPTLQS